MIPRRGWLPMVVLGSALLPSVSIADDEFERPPIEYSKSEPNNLVSQLQTQIDRGEAELPSADRLGYLPALLDALDIHPDSQLLVYSKTSLQVRRISPRKPRAIYFNDDLAVGFCQSGDVLEVTATDPVLGTVFYTIDQHAAKPKFTRQSDNCLVCHSSSRTDGIPGHLARSVAVDSGGQLILSAGSQTVDHRTPIDQRWGGWYVTGQPTGHRHRGNLTFESRDDPDAINTARAGTVADLADRVDISQYLAPTSDIVALMVYEHQNLVHNRITQANFTTRQALLYEAEMIRAFEEPAGTRYDSTHRRIESAAERLVQALLLVGEAPLNEPMAGTSGFAARFEQLGPKDDQGRSLRDFDLKTRLFRYPCSYLIYSPSFDALPAEILEVVWTKLHHVLSGRDDRKEYAHLSPSDRSAIRDILIATKPSFAERRP